MPAYSGQSDGDFPAQGEHFSVSSRAVRARLHFPNADGPFVVQSEYDDGNGLWIINGETPSDQGKTRKYYPQEYTPS